MSKSDHVEANPASTSQPRVWKQAMTTKRTQRYQLTAEFLLKDRKDYKAVRQGILEILKNWESAGKLQFDYIAVEKVLDEVKP